jgi:hypothetical protein
MGSDIDVFDELRKSWSAPIVARSEVARFTGGLLHPRTLANLDAKGEGPPRVYFGRKAAYLRDGLIEWMRGRQNKH